jgi:uncharacterized membrane protein SirB2
VPTIAAHAGHWLIYVLYAVPLLIVVGSIVLSIVRQRREDAEKRGPDPL